MANDVIVTVSMSVKPEQLETLLSMIPALQKETVGRPGGANPGHRSCAPLGGARAHHLSCLCRSARADLTPGA